MKYGLFIGRFQPFHNGHLSVALDALNQVDRLIIAIGSCNVARNIKNPWSGDQRERMIWDAIPKEHWHRIVFTHLNDYTYNDNLWVSQVQQKVDEASDGSDDITLFGRDKDHSTYYLSLFPQWKFSPAKGVALITATEIRDLYFHCDLMGLQRWVPDPVYQRLRTYMQVGSFSPTAEFLHLKEEFEHVLKYKEAWKGAPYPPFFVTADSVVIKSGHVLVVKRKFHPGKGLWALPGGYVQETERIRVAAIRELKEETGIAISSDELRKAITDYNYFDDPDRSLRGRVVTHAFAIDLGSGTLPRVKGNDDAEKAKWIPISEVASRGCEFFEDHASIIQFFSSKF